MLIDIVRKAVRVDSTCTDDEIEVYIEAAKADMRRLGIRKELVDDETTMHPMVKHAIMCYCAGSYGLENTDAPRYRTSYYRIVTNLVNSSLNESLYEEPEQADTTPDNPDTAIDNPDTGSDAPDAGDGEGGANP